MDDEINKNEYISSCICLLSSFTVAILSNLHALFLLQFLDGMWKHVIGCRIPGISRTQKNAIQNTLPTHSTVSLFGILLLSWGINISPLFKDFHCLEVRKKEKLLAFYIHNSLSCLRIAFLGNDKVFSQFYFDKNRPTITAFYSLFLFTCHLSLGDIIYILTAKITCEFDRIILHSVNSLHYLIVQVLHVDFTKSSCI